MNQLSHSRCPWIPVCLLLALSACADALVDPATPDIPEGQAQLVIYMEMNSATVSGLVVEITAPDLSNPIIANIPVSMGIGSGTVLVPAGSDRTITITAFNADGIATHRGSQTLHVVEGTNPTVSVELEPVFGDVPIEVAVGSYVVTVTPNSAVLRVGDVQRLNAGIRDGHGNPVRRMLTYGSTNPVVASVNDRGVVQALALGTADIVVSFGDFQAVVAITVTDLEFTQVVAGERHACALDSDGAAYCWGAGGNGQLGNGSFANQWSPVAVDGGHEFAFLTTGGLQTCGVTTSGEGYCWGRGSVLGDNSSATRVATPTLIHGGHIWSTIDMGIFHACGVTSSGDAYCWGSGGAGRLGNGAMVSSDVPVPVSGGLTFASVSAGRVHSCGVTTTGEGYCWGEGADGRRGDNITTDSPVPTVVSGGHLWASISAGGHHTCGTTTANEAYCWGWGGQGQLGLGFQAIRRIPVPVNSPLTWTNISAGANHTCAVSAGGDAWCWGFGSGGQMGNGTQDFFNLGPVLVSGGLQFQTVTTSGSPYFLNTSILRGFSCGLTVNRGVFCWGANARGNLGDGTNIDRLVPTAIAAP